MSAMQSQVSRKEIDFKFNVLLNNLKMLNLISLSSNKKSIRVFDQV
jgi:hypothetical protein